MPMTRSKPQVEVKEEVEFTPYDSEITANRVRKMADKAEVKHKDLASWMGISAVTMSQRLTNKKYFTVSEIYWLADSFGVSADWLLGREDA